jgi:hypothetical protein
MVGSDDVTDPGADFADLTILRLELSGQRPRRCGRWKPR